MRWSRAVLLWQLSVWALATSSCAPSGGDVEEEARANVPAVVGAKTAVAAVGPFVRSVSALGIVSPRPGSFAALGAPGPTRVARIFVAAGQSVHQGDSLVEFDRGPFDAAARSADLDAVVINPDYMVFSRLPAIVALARARRLPTMGFDATQVEAGLLAGYGGGLEEIARQAAVQVDRVLRGEAPATIPVEAPRKYRLFVNLATAKEIGVALPPEFLYQADGYYR